MLYYKYHVLFVLTKKLSIFLFSNSTCAVDLLYTTVYSQCTKHHYADVKNNIFINKLIKTVSKS